MGSKGSTVERNTTKEGVTLIAPHILVLGMEPRSLINFRGPLLKTLRDRDLKVTAAAQPAPDALVQQLAAIGVEFAPVPVARGGMNPLHDLRSLISMVRLFRRLRPDLVISYTPKPVIYGSIAARVAGVRQIAAMLTGLGFAFIDGAETNRRVARHVSVLLYRLALRCCTNVIFHNRDDLETMQRLGLITPSMKVSVVNGSGVDLQQFQRQPLPDAPVFLMVSRLLSDKGIREYGEAAERLRRALPSARTLLLGGLDPSPNSLTPDELDGLKAAGMEYLGFAEDVRPAMAAASVIVLPSYREGLPRSLLEGLALGRAIVTCDVPGCREVVDEGVNGLLVPPRDSDALYKAMLQLALNAPMRSSMGEKSRLLAEEKFEAGLVARQTLEAAGL